MLKRKGYKLLLLFIIVLLLSLISIRIAFSQSLNDFFQYWLASNFILSGLDPYDANLWLEGHVKAFGPGHMWSRTFIYPLPTAVLFIPFSFFTYRAAYSIWIFLSMLAIIGSAVFFFSITKPADLSGKEQLSYLFPLIAGVILFRPVFPLVYNGQIGSFILLMIVLTVNSWNKGKWFLGGVLIMLSTLKPQLGVPLIFLLFIWAILEKNYRIVAGMFLGGMGLLIAGWLIDINWIGRYLKIGPQSALQKISIHPSVWGGANYLCSYTDPCSTIVGIFAALVILALFAYLLYRFHGKLSPIQIVCLSICITLLITMKLWVYDQALLIFPIIFGISVMMKLKRFPYLLISSIFILIDVFAFVLLYVASTIRMDTWNLLVTLLVFGFTIWGIYHETTDNKHTDLLERKVRL